jgi:REP element-mobilizing transposase RayT
MPAGNSFHRRSIRLPGYDYSQPGDYFITLVTHNRQNLFGDILGECTRLNPLGQLVRTCWLEIPHHYPNTELGEFIVMPNHFHAIITITDDSRWGTIYRAPTTEQFGKPVAGSIPTIIRTFKAAVTRIAARKMNTPVVWQRNYYEHIITSDREYENIDAYIASNPANWLSDSERQNSEGNKD